MDWRKLSYRPLIYPYSPRILTIDPRIRPLRPWFLEPQGSIWGLDFAGDDDQVEVVNSSELFGMAKLTVEVWVKLNVLPSVKAESANLVTQRRSASPFQSYFLNVLSSNDKLRFSVRNVSETEASGNSSTALIVNQWYHCVGVYDGANVTAYLDAVQGTSAALTGNVLTSTSVLRLGANASTSNRLKGQICYVRIHDRALSADEIRRHSENPQIQPDMRGLIGWWRFQEGFGVANGTQIRDWSGQGNHGSMQNFSGTPWQNIGIQR